MNFTALPGIAAVFGFELPQTNVVVSEEEHSHSPVTIYEKTLPKTLNVHDFLKFSESISERTRFLVTNENLFASPLLSIFSPPPEA